MDESKYTQIMERREFMKAYLEREEEVISDQELGKAQPSIEIPVKGEKIIPLPRNYESVIKNKDILSLFQDRCSRRNYTEESLSLQELAFLLWATQGVKKVGTNNKFSIRTSPSAGARHPFETYLFVSNVEGLEPGLYHYIATEHKLEFLRNIENQKDRLTEAFCGQTFFASAPVSFVWTVIPYRTEWRYVTKAQKYALVDIGHVCENLYIACEAIRCGTCAIGAYEQNQADALLGLSSEPSYSDDNEFVVYAASVGKF